MYATRVQEEESFHHPKNLLDNPHYFELFFNLMSMDG